jgi:hypothetical protein
LTASDTTVTVAALTHCVAGRITHNTIQYYGIRFPIFVLANPVTRAIERTALWSRNANFGAAAALHATQHAQGGLDPVLPGNIGAVSVTNGAVTTASTSSGVVRNIFTSTGTPTGGIDGDIWLKYV